MKKILLLIPLLCAFLSTVYSQDDLMDLLNEGEEEQTDYTIATFKAMRIVNGHSIEIPAPGDLQFLISHRFGELGSGAQEFFGLDQANMRLGFEYGVNPWMAVGFGRTNIAKTYDGFLKFKLLRQSTGKRNVPITAVWFSNIAINTLPFSDPTKDNLFSSRISYTHQLMIARKFSEAFSLQLTPTMVHRNLVATPEIENDVFAIGVGGRYKLSGSLSFNVEYFHLLPGHTADNFQNALSFGFDIETGGHVFQLMVSNSRSMTENLFITNTIGDWGDGGIHFGFTISRVFTIKRK